ncbi:MAG TPA: hypothetical protein VFB22_13670 [Candidatus Baltobacteraceae bacterium]|nr:hypothetical protein [Candidatus Baltobacteraceae bacterium]
MRRRHARPSLCALLAVALGGCAVGGTSLPYAGPPNNAGGGSGSNVPAGTGSALIRFVQGSVGYASVDVCVDQLPLAYTGSSVAYSHASALYAVSGGNGSAHVISVYAPTAGTAPGSECATAPGPYFGEAPIAYTVLSPPASTTGSRLTVVLGGRGTATSALYVFAEPDFAAVPAGIQAVAHNVAEGEPLTFGYLSASGDTPIPGETSVPIAKPSGTTAVVNQATGPSLLPTQPSSPLTFTAQAYVEPTPAEVSVGAPSSPATYELYAVNGANNFLSLIAVQETTTGYGF